MQENTEEEIIYKDEFDRAKMLIKEGRLSEAQDILDSIKEKSGKKYFVQSLLYKEKGWYNEQRKQLKAAIKAEPDNEEYKKELDELEKFRQTDEFKTLKKQQQMGDATYLCGECTCACCCEGACQALCEGLGSC